MRLSEEGDVKKFFLSADILADIALIASSAWLRCVLMGD
jgi:hypothetical protein